MSISSIRSGGFPWTVREWEVGHTLRACKCVYLHSVFRGVPLPAASGTVSVLNTPKGIHLHQRCKRVTRVPSHTLFHCKGFLVWGFLLIDFSSQSFRLLRFYVQVKGSGLTNSKAPLYQGHGVRMKPQRAAHCCRLQGL